MQDGLQTTGRKVNQNQIAGEEGGDQTLHLKALSVMRIWKRETDRWKRLGLVAKVCRYKGCRKNRQSTRRAAIGDTRRADKQHRESRDEQSAQTSRSISILVPLGKTNELLSERVNTKSPSDLGLTFPIWRSAKKHNASES